jgi:hypothetical protein
MVSDIDRWIVLPLIEVHHPIQFVDRAVDLQPKQGFGSGVCQYNLNAHFRELQANTSWQSVVRDQFIDHVKGS